ncbi:hypothetical protein AVEN_224615-1 [Araneus ventricosus]|uniref:Tc3 transposase DNA binding domain-containing protein n=1 Tax=Araneus ventricosus TaxID=182803 RepID=A0A4Y2WR25_ARAVE|nr:hypothetical protein AVEN_224615-1 [Araneus ventricosus]
MKTTGRFRKLRLPLLDDFTPQRGDVQRLTEFERGRVVELREGGFSFRDVAERLGRNVSTVHDCWQKYSREGTASRIPVSGRPRGTTEREDRRVRRMAVAHRAASAAEIRAAVGTTVTQRIVTNRLLQRQLRARRPVACIPLTPNHCRLRCERCQARAHWRTDPEFKGGVFQQDNARPHTAVVTQHALPSVDMLSWPARSPDLSPIEHVWDNIGQLQRYPQPALIVLVLTDQVKQAWNSIPQTDIRHLHDTMHARLHACIQNSGGYTGY